MPANPPATPPVTEHPVFWFCLLDEALEEGNLEKAAQAQRELARLGVHVTYRHRPGAHRREVSHA
jgi:hypothetical protein